MPAPVLIVTVPGVPSKMPIEVALFGQTTLSGTAGSRPVGSQNVLVRFHVPDPPSAPSPSTNGSQNTVCASVEPEPRTAATARAEDNRAREKLRGRCEAEGQVSMIGRRVGQEQEV